MVALNRFKSEVINDNKIAREINKTIAATL